MEVQGPGRAAAAAAAEGLETIPQDQPAGKEETAKETAEPESLTDRPRLSEASKLYNLDDKALRAVLKEQSALLQRLWEQLENWIPQNTLTMEQELLNLQKLFEELLKQIILKGSGSAQTVQLNRLYRALMPLLDKMLISRAPKLVSFFEQYASFQARERLRYTPYYAVTGMQKVPEELKEHGLLKFGTIYVPDENRNISQKQPERSQQIQDIRQIYTAKDKALQMRTQGAVERSGSAEALRTRQGQSVYKLHDVTQGERFIQYLEEGGNLFESADQEQGRMRQSVEALAYEMADVSIKTQTFCREAGLGTQMKSDLGAAVDKLVDYHLGSREKGTSPYRGQQHAADQVYSSKEVYKIYYSIMSRYKATGNAKDALDYALDYTGRQFHARKESAAYGTAPPYAEAEVLFGEKGALMLERDWKRYLRLIRKEGQVDLQRAFSHYSPWMQAMELPSRLIGNARISTPLFAGMVVAVITIIFCIIFFF